MAVERIVVRWSRGVWGIRGRIRHRREPSEVSDWPPLLFSNRRRGCLDLMEWVKIHVSPMRCVGENKLAELGARRNFLGLMNVRIVGFI